jgi:hypothetical protein
MSGHAIRRGLAQDVPRVVVLVERGERLEAVHVPTHLLQLAQYLGQRPL